MPEIADKWGDMENFVQPPDSKTDLANIADKIDDLTKMVAWVGAQIEAQGNILTTPEAERFMSKKARALADIFRELFQKHNEEGHQDAKTGITYVMWYEMKVAFEKRYPDWYIEISQVPILRAILQAKHDIYSEYARIRPDDQEETLRFYSVDNVLNLAMEHGRAEYEKCKKERAAGMEGEHHYLKDPEPETGTKDDA